MNSCDLNIQSQINHVFEGGTNTRFMEIPTTNPDLPHVSCAYDDLMGAVGSFTLYSTDNDPVTKNPDRQRLEMKLSETV